MALTLKQTQEEELKKFDEQFVTKHYEEQYEGKEVISPWNGDKTGYFDENYIIPTEVRQFLLSAMESSAKVAIEEDRQQLLKAVEEMGKDPKSTWEDDRGYNQALDDVLDLLKAKDYMEGL